MSPSGMPHAVRSVAIRILAGMDIPTPPPRVIPSMMAITGLG